nr:hypothetical protein [Tanacetum cinerariifolium]
MTGPSTMLVILLSDKLMMIINLHILFPIKLDIDEMNYSSWMYFFKHLCMGHQILDHILGKQTDEAGSRTSTPPTIEWLKVFSIVLSWMFMNLAKPIQEELVIGSIVTILNGLMSPLSNDDVVNIALEGLPTKYDNIYGIIIHREPISDLKMVWSMPTTKEMRLKSRDQDTFIDSTSSSHMVLLANSGANDRRCNHSTEKSSSAPRTPVMSSLNLTKIEIMTLQALLAKLGCNETSTSAQSIVNSIMQNSTGYNPPLVLHTAPYSPSPNYATLTYPPVHSVYYPLAQFYSQPSQQGQDGNWNMDTGASSYLNDFVSSLSDVFNLCIYPSVSHWRSLPCHEAFHHSSCFFHQSVYVTPVLGYPGKFKERMQKYTRFDAQSFKDAMIYNMDSIGKYMLEIFLHQQRTSHLLKQKKLMQTQEDHSNSIPALNVDSLKFNLVVIQNTCSEKENDKYFVECTGIEVKHFRDILLQHMGDVKKSVAERTRHQRQYDRRVNKRQMKTQEKVQDESSRSGNDTNVDDADIRPIYNEEAMAEVQLTTDCNIFAIGQHHTEQPKIINEALHPSDDEALVPCGSTCGEESSRVIDGLERDRVSLDRDVVVDMAKSKASKVYSARPRGVDGLVKRPAFDRPDHSGSGGVD